MEQLGTGSVRIDQTVVENLGGDGVRLEFGSDKTTFATISNSSFINNLGNGLSVESRDTTNSAVLTSFSSFTGNLGSGISVSSHDQSLFGLSMESSILSDNGMSGLTFQMLDQSDAGLAMTRSTLENNALYGTSFRLDQSANGNLLTGPNVFSNNSVGGVSIVAQGQSTLQSGFGNSIFEKQPFAFDVMVKDDAKIGLGIKANSITEGWGGVRVDVQNHADLNLLISRNQFADFSGAALEVTGSENAVVRADVGFSQFDRTNFTQGTTGVLFEAKDASTLNLRLINNQSDTGYTILGAPTAVIEVEDNLSTNTGPVFQTGPISIVPLGTNF